VLESLKSAPNIFDISTGVYNPDNGRIVFFAIEALKDDVVLSLNFSGVGTWTATGHDALKFLGSISGEIDGSEPVFIHEPEEENELEFTPVSGALARDGDRTDEVK
jgi:hypothetical protein